MDNDRYIIIGEYDDYDNDDMWVPRDYRETFNEKYSWMSREKAVKRFSEIIADDAGHLMKHMLLIKVSYNQFLKKDEACVMGMYGVDEREIEYYKEEAIKEINK